MLHCASCDAEISESDAFCPSCGVRQVPARAAESQLASPWQPQETDIGSPRVQRYHDQAATNSYSADTSRAPSETAFPPQAYQWAASPLPSTAGAPLSNYNMVTNTINVTPPAIVMNMKSSGTPLIVRAIWWFFIGWWLSAIFAFAGWFFVATVILMPVGIWFIHRIPQAQTLRPRTRAFHTEFKDGAIVFTESTIPQHPWYIRVLYTLCCGLWIGLPWIFLGWLLGFTLILLPLSIWMLDRAPTVTTLQRH